MTWTPTVENCDQYLAQRTGRYELRAVRYRETAREMRSTRGLADSDTVVDFGAGWTEFDYCLRAEFNWRGRYIPVDGGIDGTDLNEWAPKRDAEWFVGLEILEHLRDPLALVERIKPHATKGIIISTPNPATTDVLGMDPTHITPLSRNDLAGHFSWVFRRKFYGQPDDSLFGVWLRSNG